MLTKDLVQAVEGALCEDDKSSQVAAWCQLQQVQTINAGNLNTCRHNSRQYNRLLLHSVQNPLSIRGSTRQ